MGVVVLAAVAVAMFVFTRNETKAPVRYRSEVDLEIPVRSSGNANARNQRNVASDEVPSQLLVSQNRMALSEGVRTAAIENAGFGDSPPSAAFGAQVNEGGDSMTLSVTSRDQDVSETLLTSYIGAFLDARKEVSADTITGEQRSILASLDRHRIRLAEVESELQGRLGTSDIPTANAGNGNNDNQAQTPAIPDNLPLDTTLMIYERSALRTKLTELNFRYADLAVSGSTPSAYASVIDRGLPRAIQAKTSSPLVPAAGILLGGIVLGLLAAIATDRLDHTIRSAKSAAKAFSAPVLCTIPAARRGHGGHSVLRDPTSVRSQAFRTLAATSVATDRLPRAIMISTPSGDVHEEVATNFAAALAGLGLRVALIATSPDQAWFLAPFTEPEGGSTNLPELLELAHSGRLNGQVSARLPVSDLGPNLVVIPPGTDPKLALPFDGLPPLLDALVRAGIDVAVIAGPALLENADATIVAWATRAVLWAVQAGDVTEEEASLAAARLDLAGVEPFGIALVGEET